MQFFKQWAVSVCATGIIGTVFSMIAPKGSMDKILKLMIAVFIITSILAPFLTGEKRGMDFNSNFDTNSYQKVDEEDMWEQANQLTLKTAQKSVEKALVDFLIEKGITEFEIKVNLKIDSNHYIMVESGNFYITNDDWNIVDSIKAEAEQEFQFTINVYDIGEYEDDYN